MTKGFLSCCRRILTFSSALTRPDWRDDSKTWKWKPAKEGAFQSIASPDSPHVATRPDNIHDAIERKGNRIRERTARSLDWTDDRITRTVRADEVHIRVRPKNGSVKLQGGCNSSAHWIPWLCNPYNSALFGTHLTIRAHATSVSRWLRIWITSLQHLALQYFHCIAAGDRDFAGQFFFCSDDARILRPLTMAKYGRFTAPSGPYFVTNRCCRSPKPVARYMYIVFQPILMQDFVGDSPNSTGSSVFRTCHKIHEP